MHKLICAKYKQTEKIARDVRTASPLDEQLGILLAPSAFKLYVVIVEQIRGQYTK